MFKLKTERGDHKIFEYNTTKFKFKEFIEELYDTNELTELYNKSVDYNNLKENIKKNINLNDSTQPEFNLNEIETDLHKKFYNEIKTNNKFKILYCSLIKDIFSSFFIDEKVLIYQSYPSIRFQFENSVAIPPHCDSDDIGKHPLGEKNFIIPITTMSNTNSIYIESKPEKGDFEPVYLEYGDIFYFNGNKCIHKNVPNTEGKLRISFDFRIILLKDYMIYLTNSITYTNPQDKNSDRSPVTMTVGGYYQVTFKDDNVNNVDNINNIGKMIEWYKIPNLLLQHRPTFGKSEADACYNYMSDDNFVTEHKKTIELEKMICNYLNVKNCIMTTSGTSALILSLMCLDLDKYSEVIVPNYTMIATVNAIRHLGLVPIIIDVNYDTYTIELNEIKKYVTPKTKVIMHVSLNNRYKDLFEINTYCKQNNIFLIEDAAQSLACKIYDKDLGTNKYLGTIGDIGCFSLSTPKIISSGQGGFIVTNNDKLASIMYKIKNFGRKESGIDVYEMFGLNLKYTDIQAVITIEQMKTIDYRVKRMSEIYKLYYDNLCDTMEMIKPMYDGWHPWFVDIYCKSKSFRTKLIAFLKKHNIQTRESYGEINKTIVYYSNEYMESTSKVSNCCLFLPSYLTLKDEEINYICKIIRLFVYGNQDYIYRKLEKNDYKDYLRLMNDFRPTNLDVTQDYFDKIYESIMYNSNNSGNNNKIIVCEYMGKIIGSITVLIEQKYINNFAKYAHIEDVFVHNEFRHMKIGSGLIKESIQYCKDINVFKISLNCSDELENFYSKNNLEKRQINMSQLISNM